MKFVKALPYPSYRLIKCHFATYQKRWKYNISLAGLFPIDEFRNRPPIEATRAKSGKNILYIKFKLSRRSIDAFVTMFSPLSLPLVVCIGGCRNPTKAEHISSSKFMGEEKSPAGGCNFDEIGGRMRYLPRTVSKPYHELLSQRLLIVRRPSISGVPIILRSPGIWKLWKPVICQMLKPRGNPEFRCISARCMAVPNISTPIFLFDVNAVTELYGTGLCESNGLFEFCVFVSKYFTTKILEYCMMFNLPPFSRIPILDVALPFSLISFSYFHDPCRSFPLAFLCFLRYVSLNLFLPFWLFWENFSSKRKLNSSIHILRFTRHAQYSFGWRFIP